MSYYYYPWLRQWARNLRNNSTLGEVLLWQQLKGRKMMGYRFLRQRPMGRFIADFYCPKLKLVIEVDGGSHLIHENQQRDVKKDKFLKSKGIHVMRIIDADVRYNMPAVLEGITEWIETR